MPEKPRDLWITHLRATAYEFCGWLITAAALLAS